MRVPFQDLKRLNLDIAEDLESGIKRVLQSGWYLLGPELRAFEEAFSHYLAGDAGGFVIGVKSGTDALKLSLLAAGVGPGDEVITVANTAIPTAAAIAAIGAEPVFCDVLPESGLMDPRRLAEAVTPSTRAVIPVHLYGNVCDMTAINEVAADRDLVVVEDVAQAVGACFGDRKCGTLGTFGAFSFYPTKNLGAFGDGGAIFVARRDLRDRVVKLRNYGIGEDRYVAELARGENSRLDEIQSAVLRAKLPKLDTWLERRRAVDRSYRELLADSAPSVWLPKPHPEAYPAPHLFVVGVPVAIRESLLRSLEQVDIQTLVHYPRPLFRQPAFARFFRWPTPVAEQLCGEVLSLPFHPFLKPEECRYVVNHLSRFLRAH